MSVRFTAALLCSAALASAVAPSPGFAQTDARAASTPAAGATDVTRRVDRIERELRAVQRKVFPGAQDGLFQPEVQPADPTAAPATPATLPIAELTARIDTLEAQLARLTGDVEQTAFRQREADAAFARFRSETTARLDQLGAPAAGGDVGPAGTAGAPTGAPLAASPATPSVTPSVTVPAPTTPPTAAPTTASPTPPGAGTAGAGPERRARVAALEVPATGNPADDAYLYGYRLWDARLYPEAQAQLQKVVTTYPTHRRASFAGNLLGRAYLDNNQPSLAVRALYDNYRNRPRGERAAESVYYMGMALIRLDRRPDACRTFDEFDRVYGASAAPNLRAQVQAARGDARCTAA